MKTEKDIAKKGLYVGAGAGLVLFAIIGLLPGSFIGGVVGLNIAGSIFGYPVRPTDSCKGYSGGIHVIWHISVRYCIYCRLIIYRMGDRVCNRIFDGEKTGRARGKSKINSSIIKTIYLKGGK